MTGAIRPDLTVAVRKRSFSVQDVTSPQLASVRVPVVRPDGSHEDRVVSPGDYQPGLILLDLECPSADIDLVPQGMLWSRLESQAVRGRAGSFSSPTSSCSSETLFSPTSRLLQRRLRNRLPSCSEEELCNKLQPDSVATKTVYESMWLPLLSTVCCVRAFRTQSPASEYDLVNLDSSEALSLD